MIIQSILNVIGGYGCAPDISTSGELKQGRRIASFSPVWAI